MRDPLVEATALLNQRREELRAELRRVEEAIGALANVGRPTSSRPARDGTQPSVRSKAVHLLEEEDREWTVAQIIEEHQRRGVPLQGTDPRNALRSALVEAVKANLLYRPSTGKYRATKWLGTGNPAKSAPVVRPASPTGPFYGGGDIGMGEAVVP